MNYKAIIYAAFVIFVGCVSGSKHDGRTLGESLNGENYESTNVVLGVPVLERKAVLRKISGQVYCGEGMTQTPANHASVSLMKENQVVTSISTETSGRFTLSAPIDTNFSYHLTVTSSCGTWSKFLPRGQKEPGTEEVIHLTK